jgi:hypothetical protein
MQRYGRRLRIWESNYGRNDGWVIERHGAAIAILTEPRPEELFWDSYRMEIVADDRELRARMLTSEFWAEADTECLVWRNRKSGEVAKFAIPAISPFPEPGRLMTRGSYLSIGEPVVWDRMVLCVRRWLRRGRG